MAVNKAVYGMLKYEKALGNAISNTLCRSVLGGERNQRLLGLGKKIKEE